jgi:hypothetical protein
MSLIWVLQTRLSREYASTLFLLIFTALAVSDSYCRISSAQYLMDSVA